MSSGPSLLARLGLDSTGFQRGLNTARAQLGQFKGYAMTALAGVGFGVSIKSLIDLGDQINDLSERYGVSAQTIQKWGIVAKTNGSSTESLAKGFQKLLISQAQAKAGSEQMQAAFGRLGVSLDDLKSLDAEEIMKQIGGSTLNVADATQVLGRNALELIPTLKNVASGTAELGAAMDDHTIGALARTSTRMKEIQHNLTVGFGTAFVAIADGFEDFGTALGGRMCDLYDGFKDWWGAIKALFSGDLDEANARAKSWWKNMIGEGQGTAMAAEMIAENQAARVAPAAPKAPINTGEEVVTKQSTSGGGGGGGGGATPEDPRMVAAANLNKAAKIRQETAESGMTDDEKAAAIRARMKLRQYEAKNTNTGARAEMNVEQAQDEKELAEVEGRIRTERIRRKALTPSERSAENRAAGREKRAGRAFDKRAAQAAKDGKANDSGFMDAFGPKEDGDALKIWDERDFPKGKNFADGMGDIAGKPGADASGKTLSDVVAAIKSVEKRLDRLDPGHLA